MFLERLLPHLIPKEEDSVEEIKSKSKHVELVLSKIDASHLEDLDYIFYRLIDYTNEAETLLFKEYVEKIIELELWRMMDRVNFQNVLGEHIDINKENEREIALQSVKELVMEKHDEFTNPEIKTEERFLIDYQLTVSNLIEEKTQELLMQTVTIFQSGEMIDKVLKKGAVDCIEYFQNQSALLVDSLILKSEEYTQYINESEVLEAIGKFGMPTLDEYFGALYAKTMINLEGSPGVGKSRVSMGSAYCTIEVGTKTLILSYELSRGEVLAYFYSRHFYSMYGKYLPNFKILTRDLPESYVGKLEICKADFHAKYDNLLFIEEAVPYERLERTIKRHLKNGVRYVQLDNVPCVETEITGRNAPTEREIAKGVYRKTKRLSVSYNACFWNVNQLGDDGVNAAAKGGVIHTNMGFGTREGNKAADLGFVITENEAQIRQGQIRWDNVKARNYEKMSTQVFKHVKACCLYDHEVGGERRA